MVNKLSREEIEQIKKYSALLDSKFTFPIGGFKLGLDSLIGLIPGIGDSLTAAISSWFVLKAHKAGMPVWLKALMLWNIFIDWLFGLIPFIGDIFDIAWKANQKNAKLILDYLEKQE